MLIKYGLKGKSGIINGNVSIKFTLRPGIQI